MHFAAKRIHYGDVSSYGNKWQYTFKVLAKSDSGDGDDGILGFTISRALVEGGIEQFLWDTIIATGWLQRNPAADVSRANTWFMAPM